MSPDAHHDLKQHAIERSCGTLCKYPGLVHRLLLCEDDEDQRELLAHALRWSGFQVFTVALGEDAIERMSFGDITCGLFDIGLPDVNGWTVARRVRALPLPRRPELFAITAYASDADRRQSVGAGFDGHLVKPVAISRIFSVLSPVRSGRAAVPPAGSSLH